MFFTTHIVNYVFFHGPQPRSLGQAVLTMSYRILAFGQRWKGAGHEQKPRGVVVEVAVEVVVVVEKKKKKKKKKKK